MVRDRDMRNSAREPHSCSLLCLGPLTFHSNAMGDAVTLREGCHIAERREGTFRNGLVFSNRSVRIREKVHLRVEKDVLRWTGGLRVGFTNVPPSARSLPLPCLSIPNLTDKPGHWAAPVHEYYCQPGSELKFWVSNGGSVYVQTSNEKHKVLEGVDLSKPLWAMIDIYGQTSSIFLLGSEKMVGVFTKRSCPAPVRRRLTSTDVESLSSLLSDLSIFSFDMSDPAETQCVACLDEEANLVLLPCSHRCLCRSCYLRVLEEFGTCPLCRKEL